MELLEKMKEADVKTISREELVDIKQIIQEDILEDWTREECLRRFIEKVGNPYCFCVGKVVVKTSFIKGVSINQRFEELVLSNK